MRPPLRFEERSKPAVLTRLNDSAKSRVLSIQEYFILAAKALRFIFARPFYGQDVVGNAVTATGSINIDFANFGD